MAAVAARVLALLAALGMVAGAFAVRAALDDDGGGGGGGSGGGDGEFVLVCASELGDLCDELDARTEPANRTADELIDLERDAEPELDAWLVPGPWPQMVDQVRELAGDDALFATPDAVATTRLAVVVRGGAIDDECRRDWACVADGSHNVGALGVRHAVGVMARAAALSAKVGTADYGSEAFEAEAAWLTGVTNSLDRDQFGAGTLQRFLTTPGSADGFITTAAQARSADEDDPILPEPAVTVELTLGLRAGASVPSELDDELLQNHGWETGQPPAGTASGLPSPDVLYALREYLK
jgi:hypothetical protein